jgi:hypothetical protein
MAGVACNSASHDGPPEGQISAKLVHNPRSAEGVNPEDVKELPKLSFTDTFYNFGTMKEGERVEHEFAFKNTGKGLLIIAGAESSCGCTVADFPREPIKPGEGGNMKVVFSSAGKKGHVEKAVTVSSNAYPATQVLNITAEVTPESAQ